MIGSIPEMGKKIIGLTGTYCAGKNHVAGLLEKRGLAVLDVDKLGHQAIAEEKEAIVARFGAGILTRRGGGSPTPGGRGLWEAGGTGRAGGSGTPRGKPPYPALAGGPGGWALCHQRRPAPPVQRLWAFGRGYPVQGPPSDPDSEGEKTG